MEKSWILDCFDLRFLKNIFRIIGRGNGVKMIKKIIIGLSIIMFIFSVFPLRAFSYQKTMGLTDKEIVERLTKLEEGQRALRAEMNRRFEDINKRFEDMNERFEDMNKRFEDINERFDLLNKRISDLVHTTNTMMVVFGGLVVAMMGLVFWDRKTLIEKAKESTVKKIETDSRLIKALKELAKTDRKLAEVMKSFGLL